MTSGVRFVILLVVAAFAGPVLAQAPNVAENGVLNAASFTLFGQPGHATAPGSIVSIFGTNFASSIAQAMSIPLSTSLGGVSVTFNGAFAAPAYFVSPGQINAQLPSGLTGSTASVVVSNSAGSSAPRTVQIATFSPAIFTTNGQGFGQGWAVFALEPNVVVGPAPPGSNLGSRAAKAGDFLTIYANGLGPVQPSVADGNAAPGSPPFAATTVNPVVTLGGVPCKVLFSGLVPNLVALYQINIQVPDGVPKGDAVPLQVAMGGVTSSDKVTVSVQ